MGNDAHISDMGNNIRMSDMGNNARIDMGNNAHMSAHLCLCVSDCFVAAFLGWLRAHAGGYR